MLTRSRRLFAAALLLFAAVPAIPTTSASAATCTLTPQLRSSTVNQGLGSYTSLTGLVRGKDTVVRLYFSLPSCAASSDVIALTGATLTVNDVVAGAPSASYSVGPTPTLAGPSYPIISPYSVAPAIDSTGDLKFLVPGADLQPSATTASFSLSFSASISFTATVGNKSSSVAGSSPAGFANIAAATVDKKSNALRVLVVPLGDTSQTYSSQFSSSAQSTVQDGMTQVSRMYPVPSGTGDLTSTTGGLRYTIIAPSANPNELNLGPTGLDLMSGITMATGAAVSGSGVTSIPLTGSLPVSLPNGGLVRLSNGSSSEIFTVQAPGGLAVVLAGSTSSIPVLQQGANAKYPAGSSVKWVFCGTSANFQALQAQLANFLTGWNNANPNTPADRVVGVIDEAISAGAANGCAEGFAAVGGPEAWSRAVYSALPSITGGVLGMELSHTFGLVPLSRSDPYSSFHSPNTTADANPTQPLYRTYNTSTESYISDDHSSMRYGGTFNGTNTLLEEPDYACLHYLLGGTAPTGIDCGTVTGTAGTAVGVAAPPVFNMSGTTDGLGPCVHQTTTFCSATGTKLETYFSAALPTTPPTASAYHVRFIDSAGSLLQDMPVTVSFTDDAHIQPGPAAVGTAGSGLVQLAYAYPTATARVEFWNIGTTSSTLLYAASDNGTPLAPTLTSINGSTNSLTNYTNFGRGGNVQPAVSSDGRWIAWLPSFTQGQVRVAPSSDATAYTSLSVVSSEPAWSPDGKSLAFTNGTQLYTVAVDTSGGSAGFGTPQLVTAAAAIHHPTWSPDGKTIAYESDSDFGQIIYQVPASGSGTPSQVTTGASPSWSPDLGGGATRIAFSQTNSCVASPTISEYQLTGGSGPYAITRGPDGNLWFTEDIANKIGTMTTAGVLTGDFSTPTTSSQPLGITTGPDGNLWVAESIAPKIGRLSPTTGSITEFSVNGDPMRITTGPDGNLWFTEYNNYSIGTINPSTGSVTETHVPTSGSHPLGIVTGADGNLWFTEESAAKIGRVTPSGSFVEFPLATGSSPESITVGPDANLWFAESGTNKIGVMDTSGSMVREIAVTTASSGLQDVANGPDGNIWFTEFSAGKIGRTNTAGTSITEYPLNNGGGPFGITFGADGNMWFTDGFLSRIGRIVVPSCLTSVYLVDPTSASTSQLVVPNATQPSWASATSLAFSRPSGGIWTVNVDGSNQQQRTSPNAAQQDNWPSVGSGLLAFARQSTTTCATSCSFGTDVMLLKLAQTVVVGAPIPSGDVASQMRLDVFYNCNGVNYPASIDNAAQSSSSGVAQFTFRYDPSLACPNGSLFAISNDGFHQSPKSSGVPIASDTKPPVPTIDSPLSQPASCTPFYAPCHFLQYGAIPLRGTAKDAKDGQLSGSALRWSIGKLNLTQGQALSGGSIDLSPPSGGWTPGTYTVTLLATDSSGLTASSSTTIVIEADANNDGLSASVEQALTCGSPTDSGPSAAFADFDGDGISNIDDIYIGNGPCSPATSFNGIAISFPTTIYLSSTGSILAVGLAVPYANLHQVTPSSVQITAVAGQPQSFGNTGWLAVNAIIPGLDHVTTVAGVTFSLQALIQYLKSQPRLLNQLVTFTITGTGSYVNTVGTAVTWQFQVTIQVTVLPGPPPGD